MSMKNILKCTLLLAVISSSLLSNHLLAANLLAENTTQIVISSKQQQAMGIKVGALTSTVTHVSHRLPGEIIVPVGQERVVSAIQGGLIDSINVAAGTDVTKGQVLGHITSHEMLTPQREYLQSITQYRLAKNSFDRDAALFKDGIIAQRRYLEAKSKLEETTAMLSQLKQSLKLSGMGDAAIAQLARTGQYSSGLSFTSPMSGQVLEQMVTLGQRVDNATPLFKIGRLNPLWLEMHAPVELSASVVKGMRVKINQFEAEGKIIAIIRNVNKNDQTMRIRAEITTNTEKLSPGQFVEAEIISANDQISTNQSKKFTIPKNAVTRLGADSYIFVQSAQGFTPVKVNVQAEQVDTVIITSKPPYSLMGKEQVAVSGTVALKAAWTAEAEGGGN
ncbi:MAG: efflux RND transporter periplasmic adaptor subunit [Methylophilaceae bacterium]